MKFVRWLLGRIVLTVNFLTRPTAVERSPEAQAAIDGETAKMALYQFDACPFCVKVRRQMTKYALNIELRDAKNNPDIKAELLREGGSPKVPCLRIQKDDGSVQWLYESNDIIAFLKNKFSLEENAA